MNYKKMFIYTTLVVSSFLLFYYVFLLSQNPYIGISAKEKDAEQNYIVTKIFPNSWAHETDIKVGDKILLLNGESPENHYSLRMFGNVEKINSLRIEQNNVSKIFTVSNESSVKELMIHLKYPMVVFLFCMTIGIYVYWRHESNVTFHLLLFMISIGITYLSAGGSARDDLLSKILNISSMLLMPVFFILFLKSYFCSRFNLEIVKKKIVMVLLTFSIVVIALFVSSFYFNRIYGNTLTAILLLFGFQVFYVIYLLLRHYFKQSSSNVKLHFKILIIGFSLAFFPFIFLNMIPVMISGEELISGELAASFILMIPLTIVYLVLAKQFIDIDFVISRLSYNAVISFIFTIVTSVSMILLVDHSFAGKHLVKFMLLLFLMLNVFLYLIKDVFHYQFKMSISSGKNFYQYSLYRYIEMIKNESSEDRLFKALMDEVKSVLHVKDASIKKLPKAGDQSEIGTVLQEQEAFYMKIGDTAEHNVILCSSPKSNGTKLNHEEKEWLNALAYHTYIALENIKKIDELVTELREIKHLKKGTSSWAAKFIFSLSEQERSKVSKDIHDTILQETIYLYRKLEGLENSKDTQKLREEISVVREMLLDNISLIREVCHELRPPFLLENGIHVSLEELIDKVQLRTNIVVDFYSDYQATIERDADLCLNIYRIFQELLNNAVKHSKATTIHLSLVQQGDTLSLEYTDNGIGFDRNLVKKESLGLVSMTERAFSFDGTCSIHSEKNKGTSIQIKFPLTLAKEAQVI
ncbi:PDZ domain-containing protein [Cytobacillus suaedae]|nr:PDZ domain-containing protein [Cytobacillus suaedae]